MKYLVGISIAILLLSIAVGSAADLKSDRVVLVKSAGANPITGPLKWSPDGTKLAVFDQRTLLVSNTLGNSLRIAEFYMQVHRYEWLSNSEIILNLILRSYDSVGHYSRANRLLRVDITDGGIEVLEEYVTKPSTPEPFDGPWLTHEGALYYRTNIASNPAPRSSGGIVYPRSKYEASAQKLAPRKNISSSG